MDTVYNNTTDASHIMANLFSRCQTKAMTILELFQVTESLQNAGLHGPSAEVYKHWIAFNHESPHLHLAYFNYSVALRQSNDTAGAVQALRQCIAAQPEFAQAYINLGRALEDCGLIDEAIGQWKTYSEMTNGITAEKLSHRLMALQHAGRVLENHNRLQEAEDILWEAMELRPDRKESAQHWIAIRQRQCKWPTLKTSEYISSRDLVDALSPMTLACHIDDPIFQMAKAYRYCKTLVGDAAQNTLPQKAPRNRSKHGEKIRIGYLSSDLREHAVGFALSELLEHHDKTKFEFFAYYCGEPKQNDPVQMRIRKMMDQWLDINSMSDLEVAQKIQQDEIDILLDVNGFTKSARAKIFAYRPAPVIASFCGYPGTLGSPNHQYIIADDFIIPSDHEMFYTEKVLRITCNQPVDRKRPVGIRPVRQNYNLPEHAIVYACFNGMQKVTEACFKRWMEILKAVPNSVLWLLEGGNQVDDRLVQIAQEQGIAPQRLIFAGKVPNPDHLARIALADIFLDTFPYGAHSTGSDAITMGLPVITFAGNGFASRFCASIVHASGMSKLVVRDPEAYVAMAIRLATNPAELKDIRQELAAKLEQSKLRNIPALTQSLEACFITMQEAAEAGQLPRPDFRNMDLYYEVGAAIMSEGFDHLPFEEYLNRYKQKLAALNEREVLPFDNRLWPSQS